MPLNLILADLALLLFSPAAEATTALHLRHRWFLAVFLVCAAIVLSSVVHYIVFQLIRRKEAQTATLGWGLQTYLGRRRALSFCLPA